MISGAKSNCYQTMSHQHQGLQFYNSMSADHVNSSSFSLEPNASTSSSAPPDHQSQSTSLLYGLSILKEKIQEAKSLVTILIAPSDHHQSHHFQQQPHPESTTLAAMASMNNVIQEIIVTASSMMFTCQQMAIVDHKLPLAEPNRLSLPQDVENIPQTERGQQQEASAFYSSTTDHHQTLNWFSESYNDCTTTSKSATTIHRSCSNNRVQNLEENKEFPLSNNGLQSISLPNNNNYDIIELDAADLLAKYTHYCQVCGKGFKRDANLRMHMRAHGDEYKTSVALSNPMKHNNGTSASHNSECSTKLLPRKYSCPQQGCRWNQKHAKFQPLKSMICVKNHYKRSHCPKMYMCKRCNRKQFSVLSDLRTHEKHCGDLRWQCSCGTTFSRKDKLMGHVALFVGHTPVMINSLMKAAKAESQASQQIMQR